MVTLKIDGQTAVTAAGQKFSIVRENPYFTKAGTYSFSITLPLGCQQNARIFGAVNRHDVAARRVSLPAVLMADAVPVLEGVATVTSITDTEVELQLLADWSEFNSENYDTIYIDELPLGEVMSFTQVYNRHKADPSYRIPAGNIVLEAEIGAAYGERAADEIALWPTYHPAFTREEMMSLLDSLGYSPGTSVHFLPVQTTSARTGDGSGETEMALNDFRVYFSASEAVSRFYQENPGYYYTPHLTLDSLIRRVFSAIGYTVTGISSDIPLTAVVTASASRTHVIAQTLPHWTVCEFIEQVENFAAVRFIFTGKTLAVRPVSACIASEDIPLRVTDDFSTRIADDDEAASSSAPGLSYDLPQDNINVWDKLPDDYMSLCTVTEGITPSLSEGGSYRGTIFENGGRQQYLYRQGDGTYVLRPVNTFRDTGADSPRTSLGIYPASLAVRRVRIERSSTEWDFLTIPEIVGSGLWREYPLQWWNGTEPLPDSGFDLQQAIEGETDDNGSAPDGLPVVIFGGQTQDALPVITADGQDRRPWQFPSVYTDIAPYRWLIPAAENPDTGGICPYSLALFTPSGSDTVTIGRAHAASLPADTTIEYTKYFIASRCPDPASTFIIRGKRFLCKQLTMEITESGVSSLYKGVFYAVG